jgi:aspartate oxidase
LTETQAALSYREQESDSAVRLAEDAVDSPESLLHCSRHMLIEAVIQSGNRYRKADKERLELKKIMTDSVSIRRQFGDLQKAYRDLQDAHVTQARHIQKMQIQQSKVTTYESTIMLQEKVIGKMQSVIESHLKSASDSSRHDHSSKNEMLIDRHVSTF